MRVDGVSRQLTLIECQDVSLWEMLASKKAGQALPKRLLTLTACRVNMEQCLSDDVSFTTLSVDVIAVVVIAVFTSVSLGQAQSHADEHML